MILEFKGLFGVPQSDHCPIVMYSSFAGRVDLMPNTCQNKWGAYWWWLCALGKNTRRYHLNKTNVLKKIYSNFSSSWLLIKSRRSVTKRINPQMTWSLEVPMWPCSFCVKGSDWWCISLYQHLRDHPFTWVYIVFEYTLSLCQYNTRWIIWTNTHWSYNTHRVIEPKIEEELLVLKGEILGVFRKSSSLSKLPSMEYLRTWGYF